MKIIKKTLGPYMKTLEEKEVDMFSVAVFFASYVKELLINIDDKKRKEAILRIMLD